MATPGMPQPPARDHCAAAAANGTTPAVRGCAGPATLLGNRTCPVIVSQMLANSWKQVFHKKKKREFMQKDFPHRTVPSCAGRGNSWSDVLGIKVLKLCSK